MTDKEDAVMDELWRHVKALRWRNQERLAAIEKYRAWLPQCSDDETRRYYIKWLDWLEAETRSDIEDEGRRRRVAALKIETPHQEYQR